MALSAIVVGAGVGGLTAAIALRRAGLCVVILERRDEEHSKKDNGFAMTIPPNALQVFKALDVDLTLARPAKMQGMDIVQFETEGDGDSAKLFGVSRTEWNQEDLSSETQCGVHHADYLAALRACALGRAGEGVPVELRYGTKVDSYDPVQGTVTTESSEVIVADIIVAADGIRSQAHRWVLDGVEEPAVSTLVSNIRFCIPTDLILGDPKLAPMLEHGRERIGLYLKGADTGRSVLRYACRDNTLQNFGVYSFTGEGVATSFQAETLNPRAVATDRLRGLGGETMVELLSHVKDEEMYTWKIFDRDPLPKLTSGRLVLLGDACHPMRSTLGQGAAQAVEDAGVLRVALSGKVQREDVSGRLALWEELRAPRAAASQLLSRSAALGGEVIFNNEDLAWLKKALPDGVPTSTRALLDFFWDADVMAEAWERVGRSE